MMNNRQSWLKGDPIPWLLEDDNPSVRYFTLTDLLGKKKDIPEVIQAKGDILRKGLVPDILSRQREGGYWEGQDQFYTNKYKGTVWQLIILAETGATRDDDIRIQRACEFILDHSQDRNCYGFSIYHSAKTGGGRPGGVIPCLTGNMVYSLLRLGYLADERIQQAIRWITTYQRFDDGINQLPEDGSYGRLVGVCWGKHSCHMGVVKALKALAEIPAESRSSEVNRTIEAGIDYLLKHHIYKRSHDLSKIAKPGWLRLGFPLMYQDDILEILEILTRLGCRDERMDDAVQILISKQDKQGRWMLENTYNGRYQVNIEKKGDPSKWVTLQVLKVLQRFDGLVVI